MQYRRLGKTDLKVSEIGFGGEWMERHNEEECCKLMHHLRKLGVNILDCWMADPRVRAAIGSGLKGDRENWIVQGHIGSIWQDGQYVRSRDMKIVKPAFEDELRLLGTDYIDLGIIHYIDQVSEWEYVQNSDFLKYVFQLKKDGIIRHIGISTHNPVIGKLAVESGYIENIMFSINPAFDMLPAIDDLDQVFDNDYQNAFEGINPERAELYRLCEKNDIGITVMKGFAGGRLFNAKASPFSVTLTPVQCIHYALTRPAVASILCGFDTPEQATEAAGYETASDEEKDYASVLANAPRHAYSGQCTYCGHCRPCPMDIDIAMVNKFYDLATMQEEVPASVKAHYESLAHHAGECIGCQGCESRCPFGVKISERMIKTAELFGE